MLSVMIIYKYMYLNNSKQGSEDYSKPALEVNRQKITIFIDHMIYDCGTYKKKIKWSQFHFSKDNNSLMYLFEYM